MSPALRDDDLLLVSQAGSSGIRLGDIAVYRRNDSFTVCHRVLKRQQRGTEEYFFLQGDRALRGEWVLSSLIIGKVVAVSRGKQWKFLSYEVFWGYYRLVLCVSYLWYRFTYYGERILSCLPIRSCLRFFLPLRRIEYEFSPAVADHWGLSAFFYAYPSRDPEHIPVSGVVARLFRKNIGYVVRARDARGCTHIYGPRVHILYRNCGVEAALKRKLDQ